MTHTEPRSSISSSPKHCRDWPPRRRLVTRHRCHFVKQRLRLATQTTIELVRIEKDRRVQSRPKICQLARRAAALERQTASDLNKGFPGNVRMKPNEICCHRLETRLLADCSGGNSRPLHPSGVGGGHFLIKKSDDELKPHAGSNRGVRLFSLDVER